MKALLPVLLFFFTTGSLNAQQGVEQPGNLRFTAIQQVGIVGNEVEAKPMFQVIAGATWKRYMLGIGAAIDPYFAYSFPLFLDGRFTFYRKRFNSYVYGDAGINKLFYSDQRFPRHWENGERAYVLHTGWYYDYGLGINTPLSGNLFYTFSMGVSFKETRYDQVVYSWPARVPSTEKYRNVASRFSVKMGLQF